MSQPGWLKKHRVPIAAISFATLAVLVILILQFSIRNDLDWAKHWKHSLTMAGAVLALLGGVFQGVKSHARARTLGSAGKSDESRFLHHVGVLWWILTFGSILAVVGEIVDLAIDK